MRSPKEISDKRQQNERSLELTVGKADRIDSANGKPRRLAKKVACHNVDERYRCDLSATEYQHLFFSQSPGYS